MKCQNADRMKIIEKNTTFNVYVEVFNERV